MSGKGKRKDKIKPKPDEMEFKDRFINLKRFAYDVIKFTALRFHVPESCIAVWDGKANDYGNDNFLLAVCMQITECQISCRHHYHLYFSQHYERNKLATPELIGRLLSKTIQEETAREKLNIIGVVGCEQQLDAKVSFFNKFIERLCVPYHASVNIKGLGKYFDFSNGIFKNSAKSLSEKYPEDVQKQTTLLDELADTLTGLKINDEPPVPDGATGFDPSKDTGLGATGFDPSEDTGLGATGFDPSEYTGLGAAGFDPSEYTGLGATGFDPSEDTGLGSTPFDQVIEYCGSMVASSQDLPVASLKELRHLLNVSKEERAKKIRYRMRSNREEDIKHLTSDSSETTQSSDQTPSVSLATGPAQSYEHQGVRHKVRVQNTGSSDLQAGESSGTSRDKTDE